MNLDRASLLLLLVIYLAFVSLGLPDGSLGVAWPQMHESLALPIGFAGLIGLSVTLLSGISSFGSGRVIGMFGTGPVVLISGIATGAALIIYSQAQGLAWLLVAAIPLGLGAGSVDAGLNGYAAKHFSGRHMNWLHACWGIGATSGPLIMAFAVGSAAGWRGGYLALGSAQLALAVVFVFALPLWKIVPVMTGAGGSADASAASTVTAKSTAAWLSGAIFVVYVATEGTAGLWIASILTESRGVSAREAGQCATAFYGSITLGRILVGFAVERIGNRRLIRAGVAMAVAGALMFAFSPALVGMAIGLVLMGLGLAPVYPGLMHEAPRRFEPMSVQTVIGRQVSGAYIGMAVFPPLAGAVAQFSLEWISYGLVAAVVILTGAVVWLDRLTPLGRDARKSAFL